MVRAGASSSRRGNVQALKRAIRRAELPLAYSQGFTPHPKLAFAGPLPLGFTAEADVMDVIAGLERGAVIDIAPGRYFERLTLDRSITLRGAGDLTRIGGLGRGSIISVDAEDGEITLDSISLEGGGGPAGGGICLSRGALNLENVRIHRARADVGGEGEWRNE